tara:strand:+ start:2240 stop:3253 length:1014 start_codon:yes stop_codon:yes gene_type:complete
MSYTIVELPTLKAGNISIKPYFDPEMSNLGLEKYGLSLFDGVFHEEQLACLEQNGIKRYITGLNEFAPDIKKINDPDVRQAKIKEIRSVVAKLEAELAANIINEEDPEFWNKVKLLKPDNDEFWNRITIRCGNQPLFLDPAKDPYDLIKLYGIEAGGFSIVGRSYEDARSRSVAPKFYLDKTIDTVSTKTEVKKLKNKALSELQKLYDKNTNKLLYVAKVIDANSVQYKKSTPNDIVYDNMDRYINGEGVEKNLKRAATSFLDVCALDMETLKLKSIIRDATFYKMIATKPDGFIYHMESSAMMGRNPSDCVEFLRNPLNENVLITLTKAVEKFWNQ